jgi:hypothetical protein
MGSKLTLILLLIGVCYHPQQLFAEELEYAEDGGFSERQLKEMKKDWSDKELGDLRKGGAREEKEAERKMREAYSEKINAEGDLNRAKRGGYNKEDFADPQSWVDEERRTESAQQRYDAAKEKWENARDEHDAALYKQGVAEINLKKRKR